MLRKSNKAPKYSSLVFTVCFIVIIFMSSESRADGSYNNLSVQVIPLDITQVFGTSPSGPTDTIYGNLGIVLDYARWVHQHIGLSAAFSYSRPFGSVLNIGHINPNAIGVTSSSTLDLFHFEAGLRFGGYMPGKRVQIWGSITFGYAVYRYSIEYREPDGDLAFGFGPLTYIANGLVFMIRTGAAYWFSNHMGIVVSTGGGFEQFFDGVSGDIFYMHNFLEGSIGVCFRF